MVLSDTVPLWSPRTRFPYGPLGHGSPLVPYGSPIVPLDTVPLDNNKTQK